MKNPSSLLLLVVSVWLAGSANGATDAPHFRFNTLGYLPEAPKLATVPAPRGPVEVVRDADQQVVWRGAASEARENADTGEVLAVVDFSALRAPGQYRLRTAEGVTSEPFRIAHDLYQEPFHLVTRAMYLWRCGHAVRGEWQGRHYAHEACHLDDAWLNHATGANERKPSTGGWHDAGDYNKYVVNAGITVGAMLRAWEDFPAVQRVALNLPESGGPLPDFLAELKYETDWLLTMQDEQGRVYTKVSTENFGGFILPHRENTRRYFAPWGTPATADFVAMLAQASRAFRPFLPGYADQCLTAARRSYAFLTAHPAHHEPDQSAFRTGGYKTQDPDERLWAAAEMWVTTGEAAALRDVERRIRELEPTFQENFDWGDVKNLGLFTYLAATRPGRDPKLVAALEQNLLQVADGIVRTAREHGYARPLGSRYYWGGNGGVARQALLLHAAYRVRQDKQYRHTALDALNHLFGRNVHGRSYVTGLGFQPPLQPHDRRSGGDEVDLPWPGYLVGGPNPGAADWFDVEKDYRTNEIAINWNGALIYALAMALEEPGR
jgi:endoglucanase